MTEAMCERVIFTVDSRRVILPVVVSAKDCHRRRFKLEDPVFKQQQFMDGSLTPDPGVDAPITILLDHRIDDCGIMSIVAGLGSRRRTSTQTKN